MVQPILLLGEPIFKEVGLSPELAAPVGHVELFMDVRRRFENNKAFISILRQEYLAIAFALRDRMGLRFWSIYSHKEDIDTLAVSVLAQCGFRFTPMSKVFSPLLTMFPRDMALNLPGLALVNPFTGTISRNERHNVRVIISPYGEGGRVLHQDRTILVADKICAGKETTKAKTQPLVEAGFRVGIVPTHVAVITKLDHKMCTLTSNDHLDRVMSLLKDQNGGLHLVIDPKFIAGPASANHNLEVSLQMIRKVCDKMGIKLHVPKRMLVPYSVSVLQFDDGRVLMTSGDEPVAEVVASIVGSDNLFFTEIPIECYPAWLRGSIHCLINYAPILMTKEQ